MSALLAMTRTIALDEDRCWNAVVRRDAAEDGRFYFAVSTTGVFCRPSCRARRPLRQNVRFYRSIEDAERAGFRACRRCKPAGHPEAERIRRLCDHIRAEAPLGEPLALVDLARRAGMSPRALDRAFRAVVGVSPRQFVEACRLETVKKELRSADSVTDAIYAAGFGASSRLYEKVDDRLGMTPLQYRKGGAGLSISHTLLDSPAGLLLLAATDRGLCFVEPGDSPQALRRRLREEFPAAAIAPDATPPSPELERWKTALERHLSGDLPNPDLPLDVRATAFQHKVWRYLQSIPRGEVRTYGDVARSIGHPRAVRAVASACAKNPTAIVVPCHRVIRADGASGGYRWGGERKRRLLAAEGAAGRAS